MARANSPASSSRVICATSGAATGMVTACGAALDRQRAGSGGPVGLQRRRAQWRNVSGRIATQSAGVRSGGARTPAHCIAQSCRRGTLMVAAAASSVTGGAADTPAAPCCFRQSGDPASRSGDGGVIAAVEGAAGRGRDRGDRPSGRPVEPGHGIQAKQLPFNVRLDCLRSRPGGPAREEAGPLRARSCSRGRRDMRSGLAARTVGTQQSAQLIWRASRHMVARPGPRHRLLLGVAGPGPGRHALKAAASCGPAGSANPAQARSEGR